VGTYTPILVLFSGK